MVTERMKEIFEEQKELEKELKTEKAKSQLNEGAEQLALLVESLNDNGFTRDEAVNIVCSLCSSQSK